MSVEVENTPTTTTLEMVTTLLTNGNGSLQEQLSGVLAGCSSPIIASTFQAQLKALLAKTQFESLQHTLAGLIARETELDALLPQVEQECGEAEKRLLSHFQANQALEIELNELVGQLFEQQGGMVRRMRDTLLAAGYAVIEPTV